MTFVIILCCIIGLVVLITWAKVIPFPCFLTGLHDRRFAAGNFFSQYHAICDERYWRYPCSLVIVIVLGAMLGRLVAESGAAKQIARVFQNIFGSRFIVWAMTFTGVRCRYPALL